MTANPAVDIQVKDKKISAVANVAEGEERQRLWTGIVAVAPDYGRYQESTSRIMPVIVLKLQPRLSFKTHCNPPACSQRPH